MVRTMRAALWLLVAGCGRVGFDAASARGDVHDFTTGDASGLTFTRASTATYVGADRALHIAANDEPRFDHDPVTGAAWGLLVETPAQNLVRASDDLADADAWFSNGNTLVTPNAALAPDGTMTADEIDDEETSVLSRRAQFVGAEDDARWYAYSMFVHAGTSTRAAFEAELLGGTDQVQSHVMFDLATGTIEEPSGIAERFGLVPYANGWWRVWIVLRNTASGNDSGLISAHGSSSEDLARVGSVYAWGAQVEVGEAPTSYIPTAAFPLSRRAESAVLDELLAAEQGTLRTRARVSFERAGLQPSACGDGSVCIGRFDGDAAVQIGVARATGAAWPVGAVVTTTVTWDATGTRLDGIATPLGVPGESAALRLGGDGSAALDGHVQEVFVATDPAP